MKTSFIENTFFMFLVYHIYYLYLRNINKYIGITDKVYKKNCGDGGTK